MDTEVVADLFHASFGVTRRQVDEDFTSFQGQWNHSCSPISSDEQGGGFSFSIMNASYTSVMV